MGMYDSIIATCPSCKTDMEFQSKSGEQGLSRYRLEHYPQCSDPDVYTGVNLTAPIECSTCKRKYVIDYLLQPAKVVYASLVQVVPLSELIAQYGEEQTRAWHKRVHEIAPWTWRHDPYLRGLRQTEFETLRFATDFDTAKGIR